MILLPAIDILNRRGVRLLYGNRSMVTDYGEPVDLALKWRDLGGQMLHIVDLDAAFDGKSNNRDIIKNIAKTSEIPIEVGGGIRDLDTVKRLIEDYGVYRVIIGSAAITNPDLFNEATNIYKNRIVCGIDVKGGKVSIHGWVKEVDKTALELALDVKKSGVDTIIYTDISRDGALVGVNVDATRELAHGSGMNIIASGGVKDISDIKQLVKSNTYGCILGKALYEGTLDLTEALKVAQC